MKMNEDTKITGVNVPTLRGEDNQCHRELLHMCFAIDTGNIWFGEQIIIYLSLIRPRGKAEWPPADYRQ